MSGVFYNENNEKTAKDGGENIEVAGVYTSEKEWEEANVTEVPDEHVIRDPNFWAFEEGNVVSITVDGDRKDEAFRIKEITSSTSEPKKIVLTGPDLQETYIFSYDNNRYIVERKVKDKPSSVVGLDPSKTNNIYPIRDEWLMDRFGATHQLVAKML